VEFLADGRSLVPLLRGEEPSSQRTAILLKGFGDYFDVGSGPPAYEAVRTESHKYVEYVNGERELYDFEDNPYELENVYESTDPSLNENLKTKLDTLRNCAKAECREDEATP
jgi:N-acetylglucosamine-6-sulfatase